MILVYKLVSKYINITKDIGKYPLNKYSCWDTNKGDFPGFLFTTDNKFNGYIIPKNKLNVSLSLEHIFKIRRNIKKNSKFRKAVINSLDQPKLGIKCKTNIVNGDSNGVIIFHVAQDSVFESFGVKMGDVVQRVNKREIGDIHDLIESTAYSFDADLVYDLVVERDGKMVNIV
jgi:type II secretory pathway component PulC